jgi:hypothetical protein
MFFRESDHQPRAPGRLAHQAFRIHGERDEAKIDAAFVKGLDLRLRREILEEDSDGGDALGKEAESPAKEAPVCLGVDPDHELPGLFAGRLPRQSDGPVGRSQDTPRLLQEPLARGASSTRRFVRTSNCTLSSRSRFRICWLREGWEVCSRVAACPKCSSSATATKYRRCRSSMDLSHR